MCYLTPPRKKTPTTKTYREKETNEKVREKELSGKLVFPAASLKKNENF